MDLQDLKDLLQKQGNAFEEFKATNDQLIKAKADGKSVESLEAKLAKIDADLSKIADIKGEIEALEKRMNRPGAPGEADKAKAEHKSAFQKFVRKGDDNGLADLQRKAYNITTDADGTVHRFIAGGQTAITFSQAGIDRKLVAPEAVQAMTDRSEVAILDASNDRIVVLRRDGGFARQYRHKDFDGASAFVIRKGDALIFSGGQLRRVIF